jgi:hypothetical protein
MPSEGVLASGDWLVAVLGDIEPVAGAEVTRFKAVLPVSSRRSLGEPVWSETACRFWASVLLLVELAPVAVIPEGCPELFAVAGDPPWAEPERSGD